MSDSITISHKRYDELIKSEEILNALEAYGVDNWGGYCEALQSIRNEDEDE
ncbi:RecBCD nuclease inhibitor [Dehalobacter sp. MCB1]|uniref:RecBCD nuclease inhibitor n=1 Tax=Dehalobacter sp. MCB1 TaxID=1844756 RepID=UPI0018F4A2E7|nr:RecBCD nuclease inhibitor [Dehalobacter sp. MCB1]